MYINLLIGIAIMTTNPIIIKVQTKENTMFINQNTTLITAYPATIAIIQERTFLNITLFILI